MTAPLNIPVIEADPSDIELMVLLFQRHTTREAALDMADRNRQRAEAERTRSK